MLANPVFTLRSSPAHTAPDGQDSATPPLNAANMRRIIGLQLYAQWARVSNQVPPLQHTTTPLKRPPIQHPFTTHSKSNKPWFQAQAACLRVTAMQEQAATATRQSIVWASGTEVLETFASSDRCTKQLIRTASVATTRAERSESEGFGFNLKFP